eukprot:TRINITY_DN37_c1_g1_i1.p1 TRINITY_DN37_c1_g1~~TRINITY_DN37_c1_g1_i1.p1  ORF type:complete len:177 (-),score=83.76 TRINITY_DN37_c1_g1_i1:197-727(-)
MVRLTKEFILKRAKGFKNRTNCITIAKSRVQKALVNEYISRRIKKRDLRQQWIQQIGAGTREYNINYSYFIHSLIRNNIFLNRKILSELTITEPLSFRSLTLQVEPDVLQLKKICQSYREYKAVHHRYSKQPIPDPLEPISPHSIRIELGDPDPKLVYEALKDIDAELAAELASIL